MDTDLGAVVQDKESQVDLEVIAEPSDVNRAYLEVLHNLRVRKPVAKPSTGSNMAERVQKAKDYYASIRESCLGYVLLQTHRLSQGTNVCS